MSGMSEAESKPNVWGLVGTGRIARDRILPGIVGCPGSRLGAVVSRDRKRAETFAAEFGASRAYTDYSEMLGDPEITVVAIETPNSLHAEQAVDAARAGKHVFCDKPLATSAEDARGVVRECEREGVSLGVNFTIASCPASSTARPSLKAARSETCCSLRSKRVQVPRPGGTLSSWRGDPALAGMGTSMTVGVHLYDVVRFLLSSEAVEVSAVFDKPRGALEEVAMSIVRFANGVIAQFNVIERAPNPCNDFVIYGSKGRIVGRGLTRSRFSGEMYVLTGEGERSSPYETIDAHARSVAAFSRAIADGTPPGPSGIYGLRSVELTDAMARSGFEGVHVRLSA
jgi:1,5-anhydro-D-fructose reductase (1,5-anhydro-D-mannitol-forming)